MGTIRKEPATNTTTDVRTTQGSESRSDKIDRMAPAGSKNSLGAESVRDGRPSTKDDVVEAIDEEGPGITPPPFTKNQ